MRARTTALAAVSALLTTAAFAAPDAKPAVDLIDVRSATCAQYTRALGYANPGEKPTKDKAALAKTAQDDLLLAMTWMNGYLTARDGTNGAHSFTHDWIVNTMGKLSAVCKAGGGAMTLRSAAEKL